MSIYATQWILKFPRYGDAHTGCEWVEVIGQGVPAHVGTPTPGYGYQDGDPYAAFLPAVVGVREDSKDESLRAMVIVKEGTAKVGQEYIEPLLVLTGAEYARMPFQELHDRICDALRGIRPRLIAEVIGPGGDTKLIFDTNPERDR
jgi:hypothetical protein